MTSASLFWLFFFCCWFYNFEMAHIFTALVDISFNVFSFIHSGFYPVEILNMKGKINILFGKWMNGMKIGLWTRKKCTDLECSVSMTTFGVALKMLCVSFYCVHRIYEFFLFLSFFFFYSQLQILLCDKKWVLIKNHFNVLLSIDAHSFMYNLLCSVWLGLLFEIVDDEYGGAGASGSSSNNTNIYEHRHEHRNMKWIASTATPHTHIQILSDLFGDLIVRFRKKAENKKHASTSLARSLVVRLFGLIRLLHVLRVLQVPIRYPVFSHFFRSFLFRVCLLLQWLL